MREAPAAACCVGIGYRVPGGIGANADAAGTAGAAGGAGVFRQERSGAAATGGRLPRQLLDAGIDLSFGAQYNPESYNLTPPERRHRESDAV